MNTRPVLWGQVGFSKFFELNGFKRNSLEIFENLGAPWGTHTLSMISATGKQHLKSTILCHLLFFFSVCFTFPYVFGQKKTPNEPPNECLKRARLWASQGVRSPRYAPQALEVQKELSTPEPWEEPQKDRPHSRLA